MARTPKEITDTELAVMNVIWQRGRSTAPDLVSALYQNGGRPQYEFLQGLLNRLERKRFVKRDRNTLPHQFETTIDREQLIGRFLQTIANQLCDGSFEPLAQQLINAQFHSGQVSLVRELIGAPTKRRRAKVLNR